MTLIESLEKQIADLTAQIEPLGEKREQLHQQLLEAKSPFKVGDTITWNEGTRKGEIVRITVWVCDDPMWIVQRIKKDGTFGELFEVRPYQDPKLINE